MILLWKIYISYQSLIFNALPAFFFFKHACFQGTAAAWSRKRGKCNCLKKKTHLVPLMWKHFCQEVAIFQKVVHSWDIIFECCKPSLLLNYCCVFFTVVFKENNSLKCLSSYKFSSLVQKWRRQMGNSSGFSES